jgi:hypothetical protein
MPMLFSRKEKVETWIKVICSVFVIFASAIVVYISLTESQPLVGWFANHMMIPLLLLTFLVNFTTFSSSKEEAYEDKHDLEHLLVRKPDWQHDVDDGTGMSLGKFASVGSCPDEVHARILAIASSPLERLVAIKKLGYWLKSNK